MGAKKKSKPTTFPIVGIGIGAAAGGLEPLRTLLAGLPPDTGMAFVVVQHVDAAHDSIAADLLLPLTRMPVVAVEPDATPLRPDHVYVLPPGSDVEVNANVLRPQRPDASGSRQPIDFFFRALAADARSRAIGVVLSGHGHDGTDGVRAIAAQDGVTLVQEPATAPFSGMPRNAASSGMADFIVAVPAIAEELVRLSRHFVVEGAAALVAGVDEDHESLQAIFALLYRSSGVDFAEYKDTTIKRRMARRLALRNAGSLAGYLAILQQEDGEVRALASDVLAHVTSFFRDPELFEVLKQRVFPEIVKKKAAVPVRLWVAGCATGEEVYSLAMAFLEFSAEASAAQLVPVQIFGTDVSEQAIEQARAGVYRDHVLKDVAVDRVRRFFVKVEGGYRIAKAVRDLCVFVRHDLARDPPFSRIDLATCRNVLVNFDQPLQKRVMGVLHYALNQPGFLVLGHSENISGQSPLFTVLDKEHKIFARSGVGTARRFSPLSEPRFLRRATIDAVEMSRPIDLSRHVDNLLLGHYAPAGVLVNDVDEILQFRGRTGLYLEAPPGSPQRNVLKMARDGLLPDLRQALAKAKNELKTVRREDVQVKSPGNVVTSCNIVVEPIAGVSDAGDRLFLVLFEELQAALEVSAKPSKKGVKPSVKNVRNVRNGGESKASAAKLERELVTTKEYLQALIEDHQRASEELMTSNEELLSSNEELQSLNEELETAKEELQSSNEELTTVNDQVRSRHEEMTQLNNDLTNILSSVEIPLVILDNARSIRRFTPKARAILNLVPSDLGRPIDDIKSNLQIDDLQAVIAEVIDTMTPKEMEVQDREQRWHRIQIRPYKTEQNRIEGAILSLIDINALKVALQAAERAKADAENANKAKDLFLATVSHELRTPLSTLLLQAQLLKSGALSGDDLRAAAQAIEQSAKVQVQLVEDLLDVSRIVSGKLATETQPVSLGDAVAATIITVTPLAERKAIAIVPQLQQGKPYVSGDVFRLQQALWHLLTNAIKFTPTGGRVIVSLQMKDGRAHVSVQDSGIGIEPEFLPYVFNRFSQQIPSRARGESGLGLGLAIARHIVEMHGGTVRAESAGKNTGTTMTISLPLLAMAERSVAAAAELA